MLELKNVSKYYYSKGLITTGFQKISLEFHLGEFVAITGESGSGKSTLLNVISGLESYEEGELYVEGKETSHYQEKDWEIYRRKYIGNIYQNFNLMNSYTVYQNVDLILSLNGVKKKVRKKKVLELLERVGMLPYKNTKVSKLSGGQKQRVAISRALAKDVPIIIADEPTGNLDKKSAEEVMKLLKEISKDKLIIIVTHNYEQVEDIATRKITMHDGKVLEDKKIREEIRDNKTAEDYHFKNISLIDKMRLGVRNTFNVIPKFLLLMAVYSFVVLAVMGEYSFFKKAEYEENKSGSNYIFNDLDDHRVIINKKDKSAFTKEEIEKIKKTDNVDYLIENDATTDTSNTLVTEDQQYWIAALVRSKEQFKKKKFYGRLPKEENEIILEGDSSSFLIQEYDKILNQKIYLFDDIYGKIIKEKEYVVVGINSTEEENIGIYRAYTGEEFLQNVQEKTHEKYGKITVEWQGTEIETNPYMAYMGIRTNHWVYPGTAFLTEDDNYLCKDFNCIGQPIKITNKNLYYTEEKTLTVSKTYNKENIGWIMDLPGYTEDQYDEKYSGYLYINPEDYKALVDHGTYQMSVYVKDINKMENTVKELQKENYKTLVVRDTLIHDPLTGVVRVVKIIVTLGFIFVLFFIAYFIIKIILKSRNIYFSILRMLGASKRVCLELLILELLVVSNISYFLFAGLGKANQVFSWNIGILSTIHDYFKWDDYVILYGIIIGMSILIALRYSKKLFKNSVMTTYREEQ